MLHSKLNSEQTLSSRSEGQNLKFEDMYSHLRKTCVEMEKTG